MIHSMTGFGRAEVTAPKFVLRTEVRSVNNRGLKVVTRLHESFLGAEPRIEKIVREHVHRGSVQVAIAMEDLTGDPGYAFDVAALRRYSEQLDQVRQELQCVGNFTFDALISLPGTLRKTGALEEMPKAQWEACEDALRRALADMLHMREEEGAFLWREIEERRDLIRALLDQVETRVPDMVKEYSVRIQERLTRLLEAAGSGLSPDDFRREVAVYADRSDVSEEIARMRSHLSQVDGLAENGGPIGRRLEFIAQELFREANTIASKACDPKMVHLALDIKTEVEKLREQALNLQ